MMIHLPSIRLPEHLTRSAAIMAEVVRRPDLCACERVERLRVWQCLEFTWLKHLAETDPQHFHVLQLRSRPSGVKIPIIRDQEFCCDE
jgi:hypothetical protein